MHKYDHLFFDLDNTLWDFDLNSKKALFQTLDEFGLSDEKLLHESFYCKYKKLNESLWEAYRKKEISKSLLIKTRFQETLKQFQVDDIDPVLMNETYLKNMANQTKLIDGVIETLDYLKAKNYKMSIITNGFTEVQNHKLSTSGLNCYFDKIFTSEEIKYPKPDKRIFQHALKSCNAKKERSIMIGDSWDVDIIGAKNFGIDQVYFSNNMKNGIQGNFSRKENTSNTFIVNTSGSSKSYLICNLFYLTEIL